MFTASFGIFLLGLLASLAGGFVGAAIGGNFAFVLTGFNVLVAWGLFAGAGTTIGFDYLAFGPFAGPYVMFAGGAAAAAYAWKKGYLESAKDINSPLAGIGKLDVLLVGALFGMFGYLFQIGVSYIPWFGKHTDSVALTVVVSALVARVLFGSKTGSGSILNPEKYNNASGFMGKIAPTPESQWLPWQEKFGYLVGLGGFFGAFAAGASIMLGHYIPGAAGLANSFPFAISAIIILFLIMGFNMPVQHHITNIGGLAGVMFLPVIAGANFDWNGTWGSGDWTKAAIAILVGALFGILSGWLCEFFARVWYDRGTTHVDPPASAIWIMNTVVVGLAALLS